MQAKVSFAAVVRVLEDLHAACVPRIQLVEPDALENCGYVREEVHRGRGRIGGEPFAEFDHAEVVVWFEVRERMGGVFEILERRPGVSAGNLGGEEQVTLTKRLMDLLEQWRAALEVEPGVRPAALCEFDGEREEWQPVLLVELVQHFRRGTKARRREFVTVPGKFIHEEHEPRGLSRPENLEDLWAQVVELRRERGTLPVALVKPAAKIRPLAQVVGPDLRHDGRRRAEERDGERGRLGGHVHRLAAEAFEGVPGDVLGHGLGGAKVFSGGFPRAQAQRRQLNACFGPALELGRSEARLERAQAPFEELFERRRETREPFMVPCHQLVDDAHTNSPTVTPGVCPLFLTVGLNG